MISPIIIGSPRFVIIPGIFLCSSCLGDYVKKIKPNYLTKFSGAVLSSCSILFMSHMCWKSGYYAKDEKYPARLFCNSIKIGLKQSIFLLGAYYGMSIAIAI